MPSFIPDAPNQAILPTTKTRTYIQITEDPEIMPFLQTFQEPPRASLGTARAEQNLQYYSRSILHRSSSRRYGQLMPHFPHSPTGSQ